MKLPQSSSCAEKQNHALGSEKQKRSDLVVFLLRQCFILFTSCNELHRFLIRFDELNNWPLG